MRKWFLLAMMAAIACSSKLDLGPPTDPDPPRTVQIALTNLDAAPISLALLPDDVLPCCELGPGQTRHVQKAVEGGGSVEFAAARGEEIVSRITCVAVEAYQTRSATVAWNEGQLTCFEW